MEFTVTKGLPIPPRYKPDGRHLKPREPKYPWASMRVGDSFFVPLPVGRSFTAHNGQMKRKPDNGRYEVRRVTENGNAGVRVWRTR